MNEKETKKFESKRTTHSIAHGNHNNTNGIIWKSEIDQHNVYGHLKQSKAPSQLCNFVINEGLITLLVLFIRKLRSIRHPNLKKRWQKMEISDMRVAQRSNSGGEEMIGKELIKIIEKLDVT